MENKYYTPELEEFYVGFEYEFQIKIGEKEWHEVGYHPSDMAAAEKFLNRLDSNLVRTKILDEHDIREYFKMTGGQLISGGKRYFELEETNIGVTLRPEFYEKTFPNIHFYEVGASGIKTSLFNGKIKNKNEFKKLIKQILNG